MTHKVTLICVSLLLPGCFFFATRENPEDKVLKSGDVVTVIKAVKGDELVVKKGGVEHRVRLFGIHAFSPNMGEQPIPKLAAEAKDALEKMTVDKKLTLTLDNPKKDAHGRTLAYGTVNGKDIGEELLKQGAVFLYTEYPFSRETKYMELETKARGERKGLWSHVTRNVVPGLRRLWKESRDKKGKPFEDPYLQDIARMREQLGLSPQPKGNVRQPVAMPPVKMQKLRRQKAKLE